MDPPLIVNVCWIGVGADLPLTARAVYVLMRPDVVVVGVVGIEVEPLEVPVPDVVPDVEVDPAVEEAVVPLVILE